MNIENIFKKNKHHLELKQELKKKLFDSFVEESNQNLQNV